MTPLAAVRKISLDPVSRPSQGGFFAALALIQPHSRPSVAVLSHLAT